MKTQSKLLSSVLLAGSVALAGMQTAQAELLDLPQLEMPLVTFDNTGTTTFDPNTGVLSTDALPIAALMSTSMPPAFITPSVTGETTSINIQVDSDGNLIGGVEGDDLIITGEIDTNRDGTPEYTGTLLTAEVIAFGFEDNGTNDVYNYTFAVTGGELAGEYATGNIGISVISELSTFENFTQAFEGRSKGTLGQIPTIVTSCSIDVVGTCSVFQAPAEPSCNAKIAATTLKYTGPTLYGATVELIGKHGGYATYTTDLISGETILKSEDQNGYSVDGRSGDLGSKLTVSINGQDEVFHTSCSVPYTVGEAAPLNNSNGDLSANWEVVAFVDKLGEVVEMVQTESALTCEIPAKGASEVTFGFELTNSGDSVIDFAEVVDNNGSVEGTPTGQLNPGESVVLQRVISLDAELENVVAVSANASGVMCDNLTAVTVHQADEYTPPNPKDGNDDADNCSCGDKGKKKYAKSCKVDGKKYSKWEKSKGHGYKSSCGCGTKDKNYSKSKYSKDYKNKYNSKSKDYGYKYDRYSSKSKSYGYKKDTKYAYKSGGCSYSCK